MMTTNFTRIAQSALFIGALFLFGTPCRGINLLTDPGFESGTPAGNLFLGWTLYDSQSSTFSQDYAHSGSWSMKLTTLGNAWYAANANQSVSNIIPGTSYTVKGWGFTPTQITAAGSAVILLQFLDSNFQFIGTVSQSSPLLAGSSASSTWIPVSVTATAPANAEFVWVTTMAVFNSPTVVYFDDLSLSPVPEPCALAFFGVGAAAFLKFRKGVSQ